MTDIYCGNNSLSKELTSKKKRRGSRFECFRKGVGIGLAQPLDKSYLSKYKAIDKRKMYCGKARSLPDGYSIMGSSSMCLQHGVGIGKKLKAKRSKSRKKSKVKRKSRKKTKSRRKSKKKSRRKSRKKTKSRRKSKKKSRRKTKPFRKSSAMRPPRVRHHCLDDSLQPYLRVLKTKYRIECINDIEDDSMIVQIIIKSRSNVLIASLGGILTPDDNESYISSLDVNPRYRGKNFAKYLILLFAKFASVNNIGIIKLDDMSDSARYKRTANTGGRYNLRDPRNIYKSLGFIYDKMEEGANDPEMTADINNILIRGPKILTNFWEKS